MGIWEADREERIQLGPEDEQQFSRPKPVCVVGVGAVWGRNYLRQGRPRLRDSDHATSDSGLRLQRWAGQTTEKPRLKGQLRSLA